MQYKHRTAEQLSSVERLKKIVRLVLDGVVLKLTIYSVDYMYS